MVQPGAVGVELDVGGWWGTLAVHQVEWVAAEGVAGVEDAARVVGFPSGHTVQMILPGLVGVEGFRFAHMEDYREFKSQIKVSV